MKVLFSRVLPLLFLIGLAGIVSAQTWIQTGADIDGEAPEDRSGFSVSMPDAFTVGIGAKENDGSGINKGHVRVYQWLVNAWLQKGGDIDGEASEDESGFSISMPDANTLAIGAPYNDGAAIDAGHVRVYRWNGNAWVQKGNDIDGEASADLFGWSVSMPDSNTVAIGAPNHDDTILFTGHVRIYRWTGSAWVQKGTNIDGVGVIDQLGFSVSMPDTNTIGIGAVSSENASGTRAGHVQIYRWNGNAWVQKGGNIDGEAAEDRSGHVVSMPDSNTVAIGAPYNTGTGTFAGHARVYRWSSATGGWVQKGADFDAENTYDACGYSLSMPDSNTIAIGGPFNRSLGESKGHVRIYRWIGNAWVQKGADIDGESDLDHFGYAVSMLDATTLAVGAIRNADAGTFAGQVRVFSCIPTTASVITSACNSYTSPAGYVYSASGIYTDIILNQAGCDSVITIDLTVNLSPTASITETACGSYTSSAGNVYSVSGVYADTIPNGVGCDSIITINLTVTSLDTAVTVSGGTLSSNMMLADYQWLDCGAAFAVIPGETNQSFTPTGSGSYAVQVTSNSCTDTSACEMITGILESTFASQITVYPNPSRGKVSIELNDVQKKVIVTLSSITGQEIERHSMRYTSLLEFETAAPAGVYLLKISNGAQQAVIRLMIE